MGGFAGQVWFWMAISAALLWGIGYNISEALMKKGISPSVLMLLNALIVLPLYLGLSLKFGNLQKEIGLVLQSKTMIAYFLIGGFTIMGGNWLILSSVAAKNASLASLIEISYPLFVILFAWLFFKDVQVNLWTALGGVFIISGVAIIYLKN